MSFFFEEPPPQIFWFRKQGISQHRGIRIREAARLFLNRFYTGLKIEKEEGLLLRPIRVRI
jgi:hypothetical protein